MGLLRTRPVLASAARPWASGTAAESRHCFSSLRPGRSGRRPQSVKCHRPWPRPLSDQLVNSLAALSPGQPHPLTAPARLSSRKSERYPGRMRDGTGASSRLRGGSEPVGASAARTSGTRRATLESPRPVDCSHSGQESQLGGSGRP